jgi:hypothetical protein
VYGCVCCLGLNVGVCAADSGHWLCELVSEHIIIIIIIIIILSVSTLVHVLCCQGQLIPKAQVTNCLPNVTLRNSQTWLECLTDWPKLPEFNSLPLQ